MTTPSASRAAPSVRGTVRLVERDRVLLACLGLARCLTTAQIARLIFPGTKDNTLQRRLRWLAAESSERAAPQALLSRRVFPFDGPESLRLAGPDSAMASKRKSVIATWETAWCLTPAGYVVASTAMGRPLHPPATELKPQFLAHTLALNEVLCGLLAAGPRMLPRPRSLPFRWLASSAAQLPWREYDRVAGEHVARVIAPDAILEVPAAGRRVFLEMEMGTHSVRANPKKPGNTLVKLERYEKFVASYVGDTSGPTFYQERFGDSLRPTLLFVVTSETRREAVAEAIGARPVGAAARGLDVRVHTIAEAISWARQLASAEAGASTSAPDSTRLSVVSPEDFELLRAFYTEAVALVNRVGADSDPPSRKKVKAFLSRVDPRRRDSASARKGGQP